MGSFLISERKSSSVYGTISVGLPCSLVSRSAKSWPVGVYSGKEKVRFARVVGRVRKS
jgi:hypothetical protein